MRRAVVALAAGVLLSCGGRSVRTRSTGTITRGPRTQSVSSSANTEALAGVQAHSESSVSPAADTWWAPFEHAEASASFDGAVSYYADSLAGNSTASGEPYDPSERTAASRTLPFGTVLRVTRPDTGASVIVRVNDRGPFGRRQRVLDLSRSAAEAIDMIRRGVVEVHVEVVRRLH